jgi:hypothetical protein
MVRGTKAREKSRAFREKLKGKTDRGIRWEAAAKEVRTRYPDFTDEEVHETVLLVLRTDIWGGYQRKSRAKPSPSS